MRRNVTGKYLEMFEFTHFATFCAFNTNDDFKNRELIQGIKVRVVEYSAPTEPLMN